MMLGRLFGWWPPLGRPVALTLEPPLNLPWEGEGDGSRERGRLLWEGVLR